MQRLIKYILLLTMLSLAFMAKGQSIDELREQIRIAEEEIRLNNELLEKTHKDQKVSEGELKIIRERIRNRQSIVSSLEKQINLINNDISSKNQSIQRLNNDVGYLKSEYAKMIKDAYKNLKINNFMLFLFASEDFNDATRRINFMQRYNNMRVSKAAEIGLLSDSINHQINALDTQLSELDNTRKTHGRELSTLGKDESHYKKNVAALKSQEGRLTREVKEKQRIISDAQRRIQQIVEEEARRLSKEDRTVAEDRAIIALSGKFDENKGKLPYPIHSGVIVDRYGSHPHPTEKGLIINNKGVNIAGTAGAEVGCVFEGTVTKIVSIPGLNNCVMIRHGNYITLYANLSTVAVKTGDSVSLNQRLGNIGRSANSDDNFLHFEVWKDATNLNPEQWLRR